MRNSLLLVRWLLVVAVMEALVSFHGAVAATLGGPYVSDDETVALYHLNGNANDATGHGYNGTLSGSGNSWVTYAQYKGGLQTPASSVGGFKAPLSAPGDNFTIEGWLKPVSTNGVQYVFSGRGVDGNTIYNLRQETNILVGTVFDTNGAPCSVSGGSVATGRWHHVAFTVFRPLSGGNDMVLSLYLDNVLIESTTFLFDAVPGTITNLVVGRRLPETDCYFKGQIDEVRVSSTARAGFTLPLNTPPNLLANSDFETPNGSYAAVWARQVQNGTVSQTWTTSKRVSTTHSAKTQITTASGSADWRQLVDRVDSSVKYRFRAHVYAVPGSGIPLAGSHSVELLWLNGNDVEVGTNVYAATESNQWQEVIGEDITPPAAAVKVSVRLKSAKKGSYYFDDAVLTKKKENLHTIAVDGTNTFPLALWLLPRLNLLRNSDFNLTRDHQYSFPCSWYAWKDEGTDADIIWDTAESTKAMKIVMRSPGYADCRQIVNVNPNLKYRFGGWVCADNVNPLDASDYAHDGALCGANTWVNPAQYGCGLEALPVSGGGGFYVQPDLSGQNFTVEGWFKTTSTNANQYLFCGLDSTNGPVFYVRQQYNYFAFGAWGSNGGGFDERACGSLSTGVWFHVAVTVSCSSSNVTMCFYKDDVLQNYFTTPFGALPDTIATLKVGRWFHDSSGWFTGLMDEIRVSDIARTSFTGGPYTLDGNTVGLYHLDDGSGPAMAAVELEWYDANGVAVGSTQSVSSGSANWTQVAATTITPPPTAASAGVYLRAREIGTYYFKQVALEVDWTDTERANDASNGNFNCVLGPPALDTLQAAGMKGIFQPSYFLTNDAMAAKLEAEVNAVDTHPALSLWICDEPNWWDLPTAQIAGGLVGAYNVLTNADDNYISAPHRVWIDFAPKGPTDDEHNFAALRPFVPGGDIFGMNVYPVPEGSGYGPNMSERTIGCIGRYVDALYNQVLSEGGVQRKPIWMIMQGCSPCEDWEKSTLGTHSIELQWLDAAGKLLRADQFPASWPNEWCQVCEQGITPPPNADQVAVLLRAYGLGTFCFDDITLSEAGGANLLLNSNFEQANGSTPAYWSTNASIGTGPVYSWDTNRHVSASHSARITIKGEVPAPDLNGIGGPYTADANTVALYHLDGNTDDAAGYDNNGTAVGNNTWINPARYQGGLRIGATGPGGFNASLSLTGNTFTVEGWYKPDREVNVNNDFLQFFFGGNDSSGGSVLYIRQQGQYVYCGLFDPGRGAWNELGTLSDYVSAGKWCHVAVTANRQGANAITMCIYLNNVLKARDTYTFTTLPNAITLLKVGRCPWSDYGSYFTGQMDEIRVSNIARTGFKAGSLFTGMADWRQSVADIDSAKKYTLTGWVYDQTRPTWEETRFMAYNAIIHGARGLAYYYLPLIQVTSGTWQDLKRIASELHALSPALISPEPFRDVTVNNGNVETLLLKSGTNLYLMAANRSASPANGVSVNISGLNLSGVQRTAGESGPLSLSSNSFTDSFEGHAVHVYVIH